MKGMRQAIIWGYLSEMLLAAALYGLNFWLVGSASISFFIQKTGVAWANFTGVLFAASLTVWVAFINITATDFGEYLRKKNVYFVYSIAFVTALLSFFASTL